MLSDPIGVTYNSVAKSLPRTAAPKAGVLSRLATTYYNTSDAEIALKVDRYVRQGGNVMTQVSLSRRVPDAVDGTIGTITDNSFGVLYETNSNRLESSVDIPRLRAALLSFLDTTTELRIIGGEM
jgi:hypothetical protein